MPTWVKFNKSGKELFCLIFAEVRNVIIEVIGKNMIPLSVEFEATGREVSFYDGSSGVNFGLSWFFNVKPEGDNQLKIPF